MIHVVFFYFSMNDLQWMSIGFGDNLFYICFILTII